MVVHNILYNIHREVHKIAILDIRILNMDRNEENILIEKYYILLYVYIFLLRSKKNDETYYRMIPIDHGLSFPDCIEINEY